MPELVVVVFEGEDEAEKVRKAISSVQKEGEMSLDDSAIIVKDADGKVHVKNEVDRGIKVGAGVGGFIGLFVGFLFMGPLATLLIGALGGAAVGSLADLGISQKFVKEVGEAMGPGSSALFVIFRDGNAAAAVGAFKPYQGTVIQTTLSPESEETLRGVLKKKM